MNKCNPCETIFLTVRIAPALTNNSRKIKYVLVNVSNNIINGKLTISSSGFDDIIINNVNIRPGESIERYRVEEITGTSYDMLSFVTLHSAKTRISNIVKSKIRDVNTIKLANPITLKLDGRRFTDAQALPGDILIVISKTTGEKYPYIIKNTDIGLKTVSVDLPLKFEDEDITNYMFELVPYQATEMRGGRKQEDEAKPYYEDRDFVNRITEDFFRYLMGDDHDFTPEYREYVIAEYSAMLARLGNSMPYSIA